jgi:hypothetical protein
MHKVAGLLTLIFVLLQSGGTVLAQTCEYAGQTFSPGATICECPNLRVVRGAGGRGEITSRRLACSKDQTWVNTNSLRLITYTSADHAEDAFRKFQVSYCPRLPVNHAPFNFVIVPMLLTEVVDNVMPFTRACSPAPAGGRSAQRRPDIARAQDLLDWKPCTMLEDGLVGTIRYFDELLSDQKLRAQPSA